MHLLPDSGLSPEHPSPSFLPTPAHSPAPLHVEPLEWGGHVGLRSFTDMPYSLLRDPQPQSTPSREMEAIVPPSYSPLSPLHSMEDLPAASILSSLCSGPLRQASVGGREGGREGETRKIIYVPAGEAEGGRLGSQGPSPQSRAHTYTETQGCFSAQSLTPKHRSINTNPQELGAWEPQTAPEEDTHT